MNFLRIAPLFLLLAASAAGGAPRPDTDAWRPGRLNLQGTTIAYVERGRGETVLFVHGALEDHRAWLAAAEFLAPSYHVVSYSRRGHEPGHIDAAQSAAAWELHASDLTTLLQAVDGEPVHLVGYGDGAIVALLAARDKPHLVRSLVLVEPGLDALIVDAQSRRDAERRRATSQAAAAAACDADDVEAALRAAVAGLTGDSTAYDRLPGDARDMLADHAALLSGSPAGRRPGCGDLWRVRAPALVVADAAPDIEATEYGDEAPSAAAPPARAVAADALARCLKSAQRLALVTAGPMPHHIQPGPMSRAVRAFVEENARGRLAAE